MATSKPTSELGSEIDVAISFLANEPSLTKTISRAYFLGARLQPGSVAPPSPAIVQ
jgi:hypothetical protein